MACFSCHLGACRSLQIADETHFRQVKSWLVYMCHDSPIAWEKNTYGKAPIPVPTRVFMRRWPMECQLLRVILDLFCRAKREQEDLLYLAAKYPHHPIMTVLRMLPLLLLLSLLTTSAQQASSLERSSSRKKRGVRGQRHAKPERRRIKHVPNQRVSEVCSWGRVEWAYEETSYWKTSSHPFVSIFVSTPTAAHKSSKYSIDFDVCEIPRM
jgi:hypothetical protein